MESNIALFHDVVVSTGNDVDISICDVDSPLHLTSNVHHLSKANNQYLMEMHSRERGLNWSLIMPGTYKSRICVLQPTPQLPFKKDLVSSFCYGISSGKEPVIELSSGRILISPTFSIGIQAKPVINVEPGRYRVGLLRNLEEEEKHYFIESVDDYPIPDGPDWTIYLQSVSL